jgi:hypothetical protein
MPDCRIKPPARCPENLLRGTMFRLARECYYRSVVLRSPVTQCLEDPVEKLELCEIEFIVVRLEHRLRWPEETWSRTEEAGVQT